MIHLETWQWLLGAFCAFSIGVAKTGLPGLAIFVVPLMVLMVGDAKTAPAWVLPLLLMGDVFAVSYWRHHASLGRLAKLAPWVVVGMAGGAMALTLNERILRLVIGVIISLMLVTYLIRKYLRPASDVTPHPVIYGATAGFATTVANAAGPVTSLYLLSQRMPKEEFIGTGAWFFFSVNLMKVPVYAWHGMFSGRSLGWNALMIPAVVAGAIGGRHILKHIPEKQFEAVIVILTAISTGLLFR